MTYFCFGAVCLCCLGVLVESASAETSKVATQGVNPFVLEGLEISVDGTQITLSAGRCRIGRKKVSVWQCVVLTALPAGEIAVCGEQLTLKAEQPQGWFRGARLKAFVAGGTSLPGCFSPGSLTLRLEDDTPLQENEDYLLDSEWGMLGRTETGKIGEGVKVLADYRYSLMRIDTLLVDETGNVWLQQGKPEMTCPHPPERRSSALALANVFIPYRSQTVEPWQIFVIGSPFQEPGKRECRKKAKFIPTTLEKLQKGKRVVIVTWGDSVTAGGDASSPELAYPALFISRLRERFPGAEIIHHNAGIGGTNTMERLPSIENEVLAFKPDLVTIEFVNDMGFPEEVLRNNYTSAFEQIRAAGAEPLLITPHFVMPSWMALPNSRGRETRPAITILRELCAEKKVGVADTSRRWEHLLEEGLPYVTLLFNGINHPDDRGHELFVKDLLAFFPKR